MNAILQILFHIHQRTGFLRSTQYLYGTRGGASVVGALQNLVQEMELSRGSVSPDAFKAAIGRALPFFSDYGGHDAFEFFVQLLNLIHLDVIEISRLFYGKMVAIRRFSCGAEEESEDQPAFWMLPLPRTGARLNLSDCIAEWQAVDPPDEANPLFCPRHRRPEAFEMAMRVRRFAQYVVIQLNRFNKSGDRGSKDTRRVDYPFEFASRLVAHEDTGLYRLVGVVCHQGWTHGGHYTSCVGDPSDATWYYISDSSVSPCSKQAAVRDDAYVLFYEQEGVTRKPSPF